MTGDTDFTIDKTEPVTFTDEQIQQQHDAWIKRYNNDQCVYNTVVVLMSMLLLISIGTMVYIMQVQRTEIHVLHERIDDILMHRLDAFTETISVEGFGTKGPPVV